MPDCLILTNSQTDELLHLPESGMGYQIVQAEVAKYQFKPGVVYNADLLVIGHADDQAGVMRNYGTLKLQATLQRKVPLNIKLLGLVRHLPRLAEKAPYYRGPASDAPAEPSDKNEVFMRFSAYEDDKRIAPDRSIRKGSFGTTAKDALLVKTGTQAVERYALPNSDPAIYRFTITLSSPVWIQRGIAQPAFGHQGGGIEVIFTDGTQAGTVKLPPDRIPAV